MENIDPFYVNCMFLGFLAGLFIFLNQFILSVFFSFLIGTMFIVFFVPLCAGFYSVIFTVYELPKEKAKFLTYMSLGHFISIAILKNKKLKNKKKVLSITFGILAITVLVNGLLTISYIVILGNGTPIEKAFQSLTTSYSVKFLFDPQVAAILFPISGIPLPNIWWAPYIGILILWSITSYIFIIFGFPIGLVFRKIREYHLRKISPEENKFSL